MANSCESFAEKIRRLRSAGIVTCGCYERPRGISETEAADLLMHSVGFRSLGSAWVRLVEADARRVVTRVLHRDLAYGGQLIALEDAEELAKEFLALVPHAIALFTNGSWAERDAVHGQVTVGPRWDPVTDSTIDAGVVCVGSSSCAVLWVEDED